MTAPATRLTGVAGEVDYTAVIAAVKEWDASVEAVTHDVTGFDSDGWQNNVCSIKKINGKVDMFKTGAPPIVGTSAAMVLKETQTTGQVLSGNAIITKIDIKVPVAGEITYSLTFVGDGEWTLQSA